MKVGGLFRYLEINGDFVWNDFREKKSVVNNIGRMGRVICIKFFCDRIIFWIIEKIYL